MDTARIRRELVHSLTLPVTDERRLLGGAVGVGVAFAVWVGVTGVALSALGTFAGQPTLQEWLATSATSLAVVALLWVLVPAAAVTYLTDRAVTNVSGNVNQHYRVQHPFTLAFPALLLVAIGFGVAVGLGALSAPLAVVLTALGLFALVRTVAASYRVFSFSHPLVVELLLFCSLAVTAVASLAGGATVAGRGEYVTAVATGTVATLGTTSVDTLLNGSTTVAGVTVPYLLGVAVGFPAASSLVYFLVQVVVALGQRYRSPDVPRSELRAGQRHPSFAKPNVGSSTTTIGGTSSDSSSGSSSQSASGSSSASSSASNDSSASGSAADSTAGSSGSTTSSGTTDGSTGASGSPDDEDDEDDIEEDPGHTKVFRPPADDADMDFDTNPSGDVGSASGGSEASEDTTAVSDGGYVCPSCGDRFDADASFEFCPTCGSELEEE